MGLAKTIKTISLLVWMVIEKEIWITHLLVVPTLVTVKWECELNEWLSGFKILMYVSG